MQEPFREGTNAEQMANGEDEVGAIIGVEVEFIDAGARQAHHLLDGGRRGDERARLRIFVQSVEALGEPARHARSGLLRETGDLLEIADRHDAGHDRNCDSPPARLVEEFEVDVIVEEELRDGARRAGVDLRLKRVEILFDRGAFRMAFGIGRHGNLKIADPANAAHEIGRRGVALRMRLKFRPDACRRIAAQRHDMANAGVPIVAQDRVDRLRARRKRR